MNIGSLCSGTGGLDMGVQAVLGGTVAWHCEYEPPEKPGGPDPKQNAALILAHHWPHIPNHGDVKTTDWAAVEPVDVLTAGYPCQPFSHAGNRKGSDDPRHLWPDVARAISVLRPRLVVLENVRGHVSLGLDAVVGDLSSLGYDARWGVVRASDAGAPHGRARIFITAADARRGPLPGPGAAGDGLRLPAERGDLAATDSGGERHGRGQDTRGVGRVDGPDAGRARERERPREVAVDRGAAAAADARRDGCDRRQAVDGPEPTIATRHADGLGVEARGMAGRPRTGQPDLGADERVGGRLVRPGGRPDGLPIAWGAYEPAIRRWERLTRPAPAPTEPGAKGQPRLSPRFVEWLMGLPAGHVTDVDISRNAQLKALGNGVVPQQAALALRYLLAGEWAGHSHTTAPLLPTARATDGTKGGPNQRGSSGDLMLPSAVHRLTDGCRMDPNEELPDMTQEELDDRVAEALSRQGPSYDDVPDDWDVRTT